MLTTRSSDFTTTERTATTNDTENIDDNTVISTQESSTMIDTTSTRHKNTKMDDNTFLSTTKSGTMIETTSTTAEGTIEEATVSRTMYSTTISPVDKSSSSSMIFSFVNDKTTMDTITKQHTNDFDIISNPQYTTSGGKIIQLSQNQNESNNQGK